MPGLGETLFGTSSKIKQKSLLTPEQQNALKNFFSQGIEKTPLYGAGSQYLQNILSNAPGAFSAFEAPYQQKFQQQIAPGIAERFAGMGTGGGAASSSALNNALAQAGSQLSTNLAQLRGNLQMQAAPQALSYAQQPYQNVLGGLGIHGFENIAQPGSGGLVGSTLAGLGGGIGTGMGLGAFGGFGPLAGLFGGGGKTQAG